MVDITIVNGFINQLITMGPHIVPWPFVVHKDKIWGTAGPTAALNAFLQLSPPGEFVVPRHKSCLGPKGLGRLGKNDIQTNSN